MHTDRDVRALTPPRPPYRLRTHQQQALDALDTAIAEDRRRAWVVLPPGAGKTLVGLETVRRRGHKAVVLGPNTAIQAQWLSGWREAQDAGRTAGTDRGLGTFFTALTYQSLATFLPDDEVDEEGDEQSHLARLHPNGRQLVDALKAEDDLTIVLDECHHLLEVWGELLAELLRALPNAFVLGLTATPPTALTKEQKALVDTLFGDVVFQTSIPAVVREGDLAPFAELAWLTTPTPREADHLRTQAQRFHELVHQLTDPGLGFLDWLDRRFVHVADGGLSWHRLAKDEPALTDAALRMHHHGLLALPSGARLREEHRHDPTADDWVLLLDDWLRKQVSQSERPKDEELVQAVRRTLPSVGYQWTRRGIRKGRSPVDRVLARSESKTRATVEIVTAEHANLGDRLRMLVLCDHEQATAVLPADLTGVISEQAGSARLVLQHLLDDPTTAGLNPLLVTGSTVAGAPETLARLTEFIARGAPDLARRLIVDGDTLTGPWQSRQWVGWVTRFFQDGHAQVLVGTRGLLGEGWDARRITGLVDLTAATTATSVVQTRGRALRVDPYWPEKVALTWTVVCVSDEHPKGHNDWERFCRKHQGFYGVDHDGDIVDGVAHVDPLFSPYAPPDTDTFDEVNARMLVRSQDRDTVRDLWDVGAPYADTLVHTVRLLPSSTPRRHTGPAPVVVTPDRLVVRDHRSHPWRPHPAVAALVGLAVVAVLLGLGAATVGVLALLGAATQLLVTSRRGRAIATDAAHPPSLEQVAYAVADGLHAAGLSDRGAESVHVEVDEEGEYRCLLHGVPPAVSATFATALDEVVSPMASPRYVLPRYLLEPPAPGARGLVQGLRAATGLQRPTGEVWHSVPTVLGTNKANAQAFARAWDHWVGGGPATWTGSPEGEGVLVTHRGHDPFAVTTVLRVHWR